jgi:multidrug transporter EmrE-like cation transporter
MNRYPALRMATSFLKFASLIVTICGIGGSFWFLSKTDQDAIDIMVTVGGILCSIIAGVLLYAQAEFFGCIMDIEANTRPKQPTLPPQS